MLVIGQAHSQEVVLALLEGACYR